MSVIHKSISQSACVSGLVTCLIPGSVDSLLYMST